MLDYRALTRDGSQHAQVEGDVDERRRLDSQKQIFLESALRENDLVLQMALESGGVGIHVWDPQTGELVWDDRVRGQWGLRPGAYVDYETFMRGVHPMDKAAVQSAIERALDPQNGGYYRAEYRVVGIEDRIERWIVATGRVLFSGKKAVRLIGTTQDVTEKRRAEEKLLYSEALFRAVFETTSAALAQIDTRTGRFIQVNRRFASLLGRQSSELQNMRVRDFIVDDCDHDWDGLRGLADGIRMVFEADNLYLRRDGSVFRGHAIANRVDGLAGASIAVLLLSDLKDGI